MKITEHNITTDEIVVRDANEYELSKFDSWQKYNEEKATAEAEIEAQKAALLDRLGITADEAKLLLS
jgi:hypothetical protein